MFYAAPKKTIVVVVVVGVGGGGGGRGRGGVEAINQQ